MEVYTYAEFLNGRLIFSQREIEGKNDIVHSLFETEGNLVVSAIKEAYYTNLREEKTEAIKVENNTISVKELSHCKFVTIWVK